MKYNKIFKIHNKFNLIFNLFLYLFVIKKVFYNIENVN